MKNLKIEKRIMELRRKEAHTDLNIKLINNRVGRIQDYLENVFRIA